MCYVNGTRLMSEFEVFRIEEQVRSKCEWRKICLRKFRVSPKNDPTGASWTAKDKQNNKMIDNGIVRVVTD